MRSIILTFLICLSFKLNAQIFLTTTYETDLRSTADLTSEILRRLPAHINVELLDFIPTVNYFGFFKVKINEITGYIPKSSVNYDDSYYLALQVINGNVAEIYNQNKSLIDSQTREKLAETVKKKVEPEKSVMEEEAAWNEVNSLDRKSIGDFLKNFPEGKHSAEAKQSLDLHDIFTSIRARKMNPSCTIPFEMLGQRWQTWQKRNPNQGVIGYGSKRSGENILLTHFSPLTGGKTPGMNLMSFDDYGGMISPTGDGSIIAFSTDGIKYQFLGGITIETPTVDQRIFFGVIEGYNTPRNSDHWLS
jgi:hypothetical protein